MGQALYRDYRPKSFSEVVGQNHITTTLQKAIKNGRVSHAYLFTGPRGVGKTSVARILAHAVNGLPYTDESMHLDIIEIDAASNNGVEDVRDLREKVHVSPTSSKYKIYIIDEVHMLSKAAFNALLKTLEEPPAHVIFILATTEAHKLPETIVSRTQRFEFKPISQRAVAEHLAQIAKKEGTKINPEALDLLAEHGEGSFRDSISLLDQLSTAGDAINEQDVRNFLGLPPAAMVDEVAEVIGRGDTGALISLMDDLREKGSDPALFARLLAKKLRQQLIDNPGNSSVASLLRQLIEVPASLNPADSLEIALLEACAHASPEVKNPSSQPMAVEEKPVVAEAPVKAKAPAKPSAEKQGFSDKAWEEILDQVKSQAASLYTALRLATPVVKEDKLILAFQFPLHQKKISSAQHKALIAKVFNDVTGQNVSVEPVIAEKPPKKPAAAPKAKAETGASLTTISNIFGAPEVLESE